MIKDTRRKFLKSFVFNFAILTGYLPLLVGCSKPRRSILPTKSNVVRVTNPDATDNTSGRDNDNLDAEVVKQMVNKGIKAFTGKNTVKAGWEEIIPDPRKKVAIKVNCEMRGIYTKSKIVNAIIEGLIIRGVREDNIIIYDLRDKAFALAGFQKNLGSGVKVGKNDELGGFSFYSWLLNPLPWRLQRFSKVLAGEGPFGCDYLINVPVLKALDGFSGVTISMKNHFGSIHYPRSLHKSIHHSIAELNAHHLVKSKTRLIVVDGIFTLYKWVDGRLDSHEFVDVTNQLLFGTDPVAIDTIGWKTIVTLRKQHGLKPIEPSPKYLNIASSQYGLGNSDLKKINLLDI